MNSETRRPDTSDPGRPYRVYRAIWPEHEPAIRFIRHQVFVLEQRVPPELEWDGSDALCRHVLVENHAHRPLATGRLDPHGKIGRMAVLEEARRSGAGSLVLKALLEWALELSYESCTLHAQTHALPFYHRHGFEEEGFLFYEAGIPHLKMSRSTQTPINLVVEGPDRIARAIRRLLRMTRQCLRIESPDHLPIRGIWPDILDAALRFSKNGSPTPDAVRILALPGTLDKPEMANWKDLARRLPSHVAIRCPGPDDPAHPGAYVMGDYHHLVQIPVADEIRAYLRLEDPHRALPETRRFDERWEQSDPPVDLQGWAG